jgi:hypothetical protein
MKKLTFITMIFAACCFSFNIKAQDAASKLDEAEKAYSSHDLDNTRFALQEALNEINVAIGKEIIVLLPTKLGDISFNEKDDNVSGATGIAGLTISRSYGAADTKNGRIDIIGDSPLISSINAMLSMPFMMGGSGSTSKKESINGYKGLLNKETDSNNNVKYTLQIPISQTLLTLTISGVTDENSVLNIAKTIPLDQISKFAQ